MNLSTIIIIIAVFGGSFLLMIPFVIMNSNKKKKEADFVSANIDQAVLHIYGDSATVDDVSVKQLKYMRGANFQHTVVLAAGRHILRAKYSASKVSMGKNQNYVTPNPLESVLDLEAGCEYNIGLYFDSPQERYNDSKGDVGEVAYSQILNATGGFFKKTNLYLICYKEKCNGVPVKQTIGSNPV